MNWAETVAVFGGTFDPPHLGHRLAVAGLFVQPAVKRVLVIPNGSPPLKTTRTSAVDRLAMARLNFEGMEDVSIDPRELGEKSTSFAYDTLQELKRDYPELAFIIGPDHISQLARWHRFPEVLNLAHWVVLERAGSEDPRQSIKEWETSGLARRKDDSNWTLRNTHLTVLPTDAPEISSSEIRRRLALGQPCEFLRPQVAQYIEKKKIY